MRGKVWWNSAASKAMVRRAARYILRVLVLGAALVAASAHAELSVLRDVGFAGLPPHSRVLLVPPDIELYSLSAGAVREPRADWTAAALGHFAASLAELTHAHGLETLVLPDGQGGDAGEIFEAHEQLMRAMARHGDDAGNDGLADWTLHEAARAMAARSGAGYALFVQVRDSYASPQRIAMLPLILAMGGLPYVGTQRGYAALVDLASGRMVWSNRMQRHGGELRDAQRAAETVETLLHGFPYARSFSPALAQEPSPPPRAEASSWTRKQKTGSASSLASTPPLSSPEAGLRFMLDRDEARLRRSPDAIRDEELQAYMQGMVCRLAPDHCSDIRVHLIRGSLFHASMQANGALQVWSGLMLRMENEAQMAAVLAHEIAHYLRRHTFHKAEELKSGAALVEALGIFGRLGGVGERRLRQHMAAFTREQEREADRLSVDIMSRAGYEAREAGRMWAKVRGRDEGSGTGHADAAAATHPDAREREATLLNLAELAAPGFVGEEPWQNALASLQRQVQPCLRAAFEYGLAGEPNAAEALKP